MPLIRLARPENYDQNFTGCYWVVSFERATQRRIVPSFKAQRQAQADSRIRTDQIRANLVRSRMADVRPYDIQQLIDAMVADGFGAGTIDHERAELRRLFSYARKTWQWSHPSVNPASPVKAPTVDNARTRVLIKGEWERLSVELSKYNNPYVIPFLCFVRGNRHALVRAIDLCSWGDVNWSRRVLQLPDAKAGKRDVPLSSGALAVLEQLAQHNAPCDPRARIFPASYEAIKKAWKTACERAGIAMCDCTTCGIPRI